MTLVPEAGRRSTESEATDSPAIERGIAQEYAVWLGPLDWDHFVTLTFNTEASTAGASGHFTHQYVRHLESLAKQGIDYFASVEIGSRNERTHVHAVLSGTGALTAKLIESAWKRGFASVRVFDRERPGLAYVAKSLGEPDSIFLLRHRRLTGR